MSGRKIIDKEFKINAVQYKNEHTDLTIDEVAKNLGVSNSSIRRWCKEFEEKSNGPINNDNSTMFRGSGNYSSDEAKELARLKKENRDLKDALEILKKAMNILNSQ